MIMSNVIQILKKFVECNDSKIVITASVITVVGALIYVFTNKGRSIKTRHILSIVSSVFFVISLVMSFINNGNENWYITCVFALISVICIIVEKEAVLYKKSYHFNEKYKGIQTEYEHIDSLAREKTKIKVKLVPNIHKIRHCLCTSFQGNNDYNRQISIQSDLIDQCVNHSLENIRYNMSQFYSYFLKDMIDSSDDNSSKLTKRKRKDFFHYNFKNAHDYIYLSKHKDVNIEIFSNIFYGIYEKVREDFLAPLVFETNTKVPEFIAKELDNAILSIPNVTKQFNTSKYSIKNFYDLYKKETPKKTSEVNVRRIFIYKNSSIEDYKIVKPEIDVTGISTEIENMKIPLLLWVLEWHKKNDIEVRFISDEDAQNLQRTEKNVSTLDFSITHIEQTNIEPKYKDIILQLNGEPQIETFYNLSIKYHSLTAYTEDYDNEDDDDAEHFKFFNKLWEESNKNVEEIRNKLLNDNSWFNSIGTDNQGRIKNVIDLTYPII